jgi:HPr kinase/phosphorylase
VTGRPETVHASTVAFADRAALIRGPSGSGKSALALALLSRGARLVSDDRTRLGRRGDGVLAWAPSAILGLVEARGVGILHADPAPPTRLCLVVDLGEAESERLPPLRTCEILGLDLPIVFGAGGAHLADAIRLLLETGRRAVP